MRLILIVWTDLDVLALLATYSSPETQDEAALHDSLFPMDHAVEAR